MGTGKRREAEEGGRKARRGGVSTNVKRRVLAAFPSTSVFHVRLRKTVAGFSPPLPSPFLKKLCGIIAGCDAWSSSERSRRLGYARHVNLSSNDATCRHRRAQLIEKRRSKHRKTFIQSCVCVIKISALHGRRFSLFTRVFIASARRSHLDVRKH